MDAVGGTSLPGADEAIGLAMVGPPPAACSGTRRCAGFTAAVHCGPGDLAGEVALRCAVRRQ